MNEFDNNQNNAPNNIPSNPTNVPNGNVNNIPYTAPANNPLDTGSIGWAVLGFFVPLVGLILFLVWKTDKPLSAKKAGIGALVSVILGVVFYILMMILGVVMMSSGYGYAAFLV